MRFNADDGEELALWSFFALFGGAGVVRVERRGIALFGWFWDAFRRIRGLFSAFSRHPAERPPRMAVVRVWRGVGRPSGGLRGRRPRSDHGQHSVRFALNAGHLRLDQRSVTVQVQIPPSPLGTVMPFGRRLALGASQPLAGMPHRHHHEAFAAPFRLADVNHYGTRGSEQRKRLWQWQPATTSL